MTRVPHDDPPPPDAVHRPRVAEHADRDDGVQEPHDATRRVLVRGRVEERERDRRQEERNSEPREEGAFRREPDLRG